MRESVITFTLNAFNQREHFIGIRSDIHRAECSRLETVNKTFLIKSLCFIGVFGFERKFSNLFRKKPRTILNSLNFIRNSSAGHLSIKSPHLCCISGLEAEQAKWIRPNPNQIVANQKASVVFFADIYLSICMQNVHSFDSI